MRQLAVITSLRPIHFIKETTMKKLLSFLCIALFITPVYAGHHKASEHHDIVDVAASNKMFSTLVAAVKAGGLVETLKGEGPFTVFAPTDDAFAALPTGTLEMLLKPENKDVLVSILSYHVVAGKVEAKDVVKLSSAMTVEGSKVTIDANDSGVMINNANVIKADVNAHNGVIHVIDKVLLPQEVARQL